MSVDDGSVLVLKAVSADDLGEDDFYPSLEEQASMRRSHSWPSSHASTREIADPHIQIIKTPDRSTEADVGKTQERGLS